MIEGILVRKTPYQDRHLIGDLILRNGKKQGVIFFGGLGGGKKAKPSNLEIGRLYNVTSNSSTNKKNKLIQTKEWQVKWTHERIRYDYWSFLLLNFICEICSQVAIPEEDFNDNSDLQYEGLFNVLSNGVFFLENNKERNQNLNFLIFFLGKFMIDFGIFPQLDCCIDCEKPFAKYQPCLFDVEKNGFLCNQCNPKNDFSVSHGPLLFLLSLAKSTTWKNYPFVELKEVKDNEQLKTLTQYLFFQLNISSENLKSLKSFY